MLLAEKARCSHCLSVGGKPFSSDSEERAILLAQQCPLHHHAGIQPSSTHAATISNVPAMCVPLPG